MFSASSNVNIGHQLLSIWTRQLYGSSFFSTVCKWILTISIQLVVTRYAASYLRRGGDSPRISPISTNPILGQQGGCPAMAKIEVMRELGEEFEPTRKTRASSSVHNENVDSRVRRTNLTLVLPYSMLTNTLRPPRRSAPPSSRLTLFLSCSRRLVFDRTCWWAGGGRQGNWCNSQQLSVSGGACSIDKKNVVNNRADVV